MQQGRLNGPADAKWRYIKKNSFLYMMVLLPIIYYLIFHYIPLAGNVIAFRKYVPGGSIFGQEWSGLRYFRMFINDAKFWSVFKNTLILSLKNLAFSFTIPIVFALMLNELKSVALKKSIQTASYLPHFLSGVIVAGMLKEMLAPDGGIINVIIEAFGGEPINFLLEADWFHTTYIASGIWQHTGFSAIIYVAAFSAIDAQLYEAAMVDGAGKWKQMVHVTLPAIAPAIIITLILSVGDILSVGYEKILLLYNAMIYETSDVIQTYVYRVGLTNNSYSYATAIGLFESVVALVMVSSTNYMARKVSSVSLW